MNFIINGEIWKIFLISPFDFKLKRLDGQYTLGVCDNNKKIIYIADNLSEYYLKKVISHELTHAIMFSYNIFLNNYDEELFADLIATYGQLILDLTESIILQLKNK
jgi:Zn-dependent peptidase ImmA (M78 family)